MKIKHIVNPLYLYKNRSKIWPSLCHNFGKIPEITHKALNRLHIPLNKNDQKISALKDIHKGERAFIIGMGPSLQAGDLDKLKSEITFACNKVYLAFGETDWRPTYYTVLDVLVAENNQKKIQSLKLKKIFPRIVQQFFPESDDIIWVRRLSMPKRAHKLVTAFSTNILSGTYPGWTVIFEQMQIAYYMGIREIILIGVDYKFSVPKRTGAVCEHGEILEYTGEKNHFHPLYRQKGEKWTIPRLDMQYQAFSRAKKVMEKKGGKIVNASRETCLDVFPLRDFDSLV
jgi:hypothetical protein